MTSWHTRDRGRATEAPVLLPGASGFIGSHIAEYFVAEQVPLVCFVRRNSNLEFLRTLPVKFTYGDITEPADLLRGCEGCGAVIHAAARVSDWGAYQDFHAANVRGTINVMDAAAAAGIRDVIVTGSNSCYGEEDSSEVKTEATPFRSHYPYFLDRWFPSALNHYRDTKAEASLAAQEEAVKRGMNLTIVHPVWVYGEREYHSGFFEYLQTVRSGIPVFPGSGRNRFHTIYCRNLAKVYYLAYRERLPGVNSFLAADDPAERQYVLLEMFCREAGLRKPARLPKAVVYPVAFAMELAASLGGANHSPMLTRARVNIFYDNIQYSSEKARAVLHYEPDYTPAEGIRTTVALYRDHGLL